jgi:hypothetical protein
MPWPDAGAHPIGGGGAFFLRVTTITTTTMITTMTMRVMTAMRLRPLKMVLAAVTGFAMQPAALHVSPPL